MKFNTKRAIMRPFRDIKNEWEDLMDAVAYQLSKISNKKFIDIELFDIRKEQEKRKYFDALVEEEESSGEEE